MANVADVPYFEMYTQNQGGISFEYWEDTRSVDLHKHNYYEIMMIHRGSCQHLYNNTDTLLIPGDIVIVPPHRAHAYTVSSQFAAYNLQFLPQVMDADILKLFEKELRELTGGQLEEDVFLEDQKKNFLADPSNDLYKNSEREVLPVWENLLGDREDYIYEGKNVSADYVINSLKQGVLHFSPSEYSFILPLLRRCVEFVTNKEALTPIYHKKYLNVILLELCNAMGRKNQPYLMHSRSNQRIMGEVLRYIDQYLAEEIDFDALAKKYAFSPNYFRKLFKDMTGLAPTAYINRARVIKAYDLVQKSGVTMKEAAESVGIYNTNYFSRLFKKVMGSAFSKM